MSGSVYRSELERLKAGLQAAERHGDIERIERARGELDAFVASLLIDPRRHRALEAASRQAAAEVEAHAASICIPRMVLDPVHDAAFTRIWLAWLDDAKLRMLQRVMADEVNRRREVATTAPYASRRRPAAATLSRLFG